MTFPGLKQINTGGSHVLHLKLTRNHLIAQLELLHHFFSDNSRGVNELDLIN